MSSERPESKIDWTTFFITVGVAFVTMSIGMAVSSPMGRFPGVELVVAMDYWFIPILALVGTFLTMSGLVYEVATAYMKERRQSFR